MSDFNKQARNSLFILLSLLTLTISCTSKTNSTTSTGSGTSTSSSSTSNTSLTLSTSPSTIAPGGSSILYASGGTSPYKYSISSGSGTISGSTYTASASAVDGSIITLMVTDSKNLTAYTSITINDTLTITTSSSTVAVGGTVILSSSGGVAPYVYSISSGTGTGTISGNTFRAPSSIPYGSTTITSTIMVTDSVGESTSTTITINNTNSTLTITPSASSVVNGGSITLTSAGGIAPYTYTIYSGSGTIAGNVYQAPSASSSTTAEDLEIIILVTDANNATAYTAITVTRELQLTLSPTSISTNGSVVVTASGGKSPYTYSIVSGGGTLSTTAATTATSVTYTSPPYPTTVTLKVVDANGSTKSNTLTVAYTVNPTIEPSATTLYTGQKLTFTASNGSGSYFYQLTSGPGSISGATYTAPSSLPASTTSTSQTAVVTVYDTTNGRTTTATILIKPLVILNSSSSLNADCNTLLAVAVPYGATTNPATLYPSFMLAGSGCSNGFGYKVFDSYNTFWYGDSTTFQGATGNPAGWASTGRATAGLTLTNYDITNPNPYTGKITISGWDGTISLNFCLMNIVSDPTIYLSPATIVQTRSQSNNIQLSVDSSVYAFKSYSTGASSSGGLTTSSLWIKNINYNWTWGPLAPVGANAVTIQISKGQHDTTISDCSTYSQYSLSSNTND